MELRRYFSVCNISISLAATPRPFERVPWHLLTAACQILYESQMALVYTLPELHDTETDNGHVSGPHIQRMRPRRLTGTLL